MEFFSKIWCGVKKNEADIILVIGVILISLASFAGGWILGASKSENPKAGASLIETQEILLPTQEPEIVSQEVEKEKQEPKIDEKKDEPLLVASKNGNVYHFPWCPGAQRIKEENKIYFKSKEEAEKAGYRPAKNCPGL